MNMKDSNVDSVEDRDIDFGVYNSFGGSIA